MTTAYDTFLKTDVSKYSGKWLAVSDKKVLAVGDSAKQVMESARKIDPSAKIMLVKVPEEETLIF